MAARSFIGSIDSGTSSTRFVLYDTKGVQLGLHQVEMTQIYPQPGWAEHDPKATLKVVRECMAEALKDLEVKPSEVESIGVTNQRETVLVWDKATGEPLHNAILWLDTRNSKECAAFSAAHGGSDAFREQCGLPISTYFTGMKIRWLLENVPAVKKASDAGTCVFGTLDTWIIWNLTGGPDGGAFVTDVTNASRTMLMDIHACTWNEEMCSLVGISTDRLPEIRSSAEVYGHVHEGDFKGVPIAGCIGDQQSALVGQLCFESGQAKNTYGTGLFFLLNTGEAPVLSKHGLLTTACYKLGPDAPVSYALEGSVAIGGAGVQWLRDNLGIINSAADIETLALKVDDTGDVYFVPAFTGLFAPYWREDARGVIVGLTQFTNKNHICRALLEAICFQSRQVIDAMTADSGVSLKTLRVDGGMTQNKLMMQMQSDFIGARVERPKNAETTAIGAAICAGLGAGIWKDLDEVKALGFKEATVYEPSMGEEDRSRRYARWKDAIERSFDWKKGEKK